MDESSLSERALKILAEIERSLAAEDPGIERRLNSTGRPSNDSRLLKLGVLGFLAGLALLLGFATHLGFGVAGFLDMLASAFAIGTSLKRIASDANAPGGALRKALRRAEDRMRPPRPPRPKDN